MVVICGGQLRQLSRARTGIMVVRYLNIVSFSGKKNPETPKTHTKRKGAVKNKSKITLASMSNAKRFLLNLETIWQKRLQCCHSNAAA